MPPGAVDAPPLASSVKVIRIQPAGAVAVIERGRAAMDAMRASPGLMLAGRAMVRAPAVPSVGRPSLRPLVLPR